MLGLGLQVPGTVSLILQVGVVFLFAKGILKIHGLFRSRWNLQRLTKPFGDIGLKRHFLFGDIHHVSIGPMNLIPK